MPIVWLTNMTDRLTLAAATGLPFAVLAFHAVMGTVGLVSGSVAIVAPKGSSWHRRSGQVFVWTMIALGLTGVGIAVYEGKTDVAAGALTAYLVFTAWTAIRPLPGAGGQRINVALMLLAWLFAIGGFIDGFEVLGMPGMKKDGVPAGMTFFFAIVLTCAAIGDLRVIRDGGITGTRRLARHLWRMCFALFIATGSFIAQLVRMPFMPDWTRSVPVILALAIGPLVLLVYWMWRVRLRQNLRGLTLARVLN
jgi:uncharacterized membrane protein